MPSCFASYVMEDMPAAWRKLWSLPWRRVTFYTRNSATRHRYLAPMDAYLVDAYAGCLISASFERRGISVSIAEGTLTVATNSADVTTFRSACSTVEGLVGLANPVELEFSGTHDVITA